MNRFALRLLLCVAQYQGGRALVFPAERVLRTAPRLGPHGSASSSCAHRRIRSDATCRIDLADEVQLDVDAAEADETDRPGVAPWLAAGLPVLALCCAIAAICALDRVVMSVAILPMGEQYGYSDSTRGLVASAFSFGYFLGLGPAGLASSATSPKAVLGAGLVVWSIAQLATPAAADLGIEPLLAARACMGLGEAAAIPSLQVIAANFVPASARSKFWGVVTACLSLGTIAAYAVTPPLVSDYGWPSAFSVYGAAGLAIALLWAVFGADAPSGKSVASNGPAPAAIGAEEGGEVPWREMVSSRPVWALCAAHASSNFFLYFALSWLPTYFACARPRGPVRAGLAAR